MSLTSQRTGSESDTSVSRKVRVVRSPEDLIFYTDTDASDYPLFITPSYEVYTKRRPSEIVATFYVKKVSEINDNLNHELLNKAVEVIKDVTKCSPATISNIEIIYEIYEGDMEKLVGEVKAYAIKIISVNTPYSGYKLQGKKAWAVGYDWKKRIIAKAPEFEKYVYVDGSEGKNGRAYVWVTIKLPIPTEDFVKTFNAVLGQSSTIQTELIDLEKQVKEIEELIKQKEAELQALREQLQQLQMKLHLERMKKMMVDSLIDEEEKL
ncbi:MAG: hypothetical protein QW611_04410 [Ignisphaera sp.]